MEKEYKTSDLYEAAYLVSQNLPLLGIEKSNTSQRCFFVFDYSPDCRQAATDYWNRKGSVAPRAYTESIAYLKDRLFAGV